MQTLVYYCAGGPVFCVFCASTSEQCLGLGLCCLSSSLGAPGARLFSARSARGAQSPRFRLPAASVLARGFRRCCLGRPWVLIRSQGMPGARLEWGSGQMVGWMGRGKGLGVS